MKLPKNKKAYCKKCGKHIEHKVSESKTSGKRGSLKWGSIQRHKKRGLGSGYGNKGRWGSKPTNPKRTGAKSTKKINLKLTCSVCHKSHLFVGPRAKKTEFK